MVEYKYGELADWNDADTAGRSEFARLTQGDNVVRIFSRPFQFQVVWLKDASGANRKLRPALENCPLVKRGEKVQTRWLLGVINRKTSATEILEIGSQIYNGIKNHINDAAWGDPRNYDLNIKRGKPSDNPLYTVVARPPTPLTDEDKAIVAEFEKTTDLKKLCQPPTAEEVHARLNEIDGVSTPSDGNGTSSQSSGSGDSGQQKTQIDSNTFNFDDKQSSL